MKRIQLMVGLVLLEMAMFSGYAQAQTLTNPTAIEFTPSADHNTIQNGTSVVTSYKVMLYPSGSTSTTPVASVDIGKPTPDTTNTIRWPNLPTLYTALPVGQYTATVAAVGPGGVGETPRSDPFSVAVKAPAAPTAKPIIK